MKENKAIHANVQKRLPEPKQPKISEKEHIIKCNSCSAKLIKVIELLDIKADSRIKVKCNCGGSSFWYQMGGKLFFEPISSCIENVEHKHESGEMIISCKKK